jgi:hypothetical protein
MNQKFNKKSFLTLSVVTFMVLASGGFASADFTSLNNTTGFNSLNNVNSNTAQVLAQSNLNTESLFNNGGVTSETGDNFADFNTGFGDAGSGPIEVAGGFGNELNLNEISQIGGVGLGLFSAVNQATGAESTNNANSKFENSIEASNLNDAYIDNIAWIDGRTGHNSAKGNTGDGVVHSGGAAAAVTELNGVNANSIDLAGVAENGLFSALSENKLTGFNSVNNANTLIKNDLQAENDNKADINNDVRVSLDTGHNFADFNTGKGDVITGDALADVLIKNRANSNEISVGLGGAADDPLIAKNKETGAKSINNANSLLKNEIDVENKNVANLENEADICLNTGNNSASFNTGGAEIPVDPRVVTGDARGAAEINNDFINSNSTSVSGPVGPLTLESANKVTGFESVNNANAQLKNDIDVNNENFADVKNDVKIKADTGNNMADSNTGSGLVVTGDAEAKAKIKNNLNVNQTEVVAPQIAAIAAANEVTGANSTNNANSSAESNVNVTNTNNSNVKNDVNLSTDTGNNSASFNTGSGTVTTGGALVTFQAVNTGNINSTQIGN